MRSRSAAVAVGHEEDVPAVASTAVETIAGLTAQRNQRDAILSSMVEGLVAVDGEDRVLLVNAAAREFLALGDAPCESRQLLEVVRIRQLVQFVEHVRESTQPFPNVSVASFSNRFLIHYAQTIGATHILRGIRTESDYEFERTMRNINGDLDPKICTVFLMPPRGIAEVSSSMVRGLIGPLGWQKIVRQYVPEPVYRRLLKSRTWRAG